MSPASSSASAARSRARRGDGDRLREEVLDAAESLLIATGSVDAVSLRKIATQVGCTPPSIYLHFTDKDELFFHVCTRRFEEFHATMLAAVDGLEDPADAMLAMGRAYVDYGVSHPEAYRVLFGSTGLVVPDDVDEDTLPGMQAFDLLVGLVQLGIEAGQFRDGDPIAIAIGIWSAMHGLVMLLDSTKHEHKHFEVPDDIVETVCDQTLHGILAR